MWFLIARECGTSRFLLRTIAIAGSLVSRMGPAKRLETPASAHVGFQQQALGGCALDGRSVCSGSGLVQLPILLSRPVSRPLSTCLSTARAAFRDVAATATHSVRFVANCKVRSRIVREHRARSLRGDPFLTHRVTQLYPEGACVYFYLAFYAEVRRLRCQSWVLRRLS